jgi:N utilization substance protein A
VGEVVTYQELVNLSQKSINSSFKLEEVELIDFVKGGAIRAYKAGDPARASEDVVADFNPETKTLRLSIKKTVVAEVKEPYSECLESEVHVPVGETATVEISDADTYKAIDAAISAMCSLIDTGWKKENVLLVKTKFQEFKEKCLIGKIIAIKGNAVTVQLGGIETILPAEEQVLGEAYEEGSDLLVYVKKLNEIAESSEIIVSRRDEALVSYAMRRHIPEVDLDTVQIKAIARISGKRSRAAVWSTDLGAVSRCEKRAKEVNEELGGEPVEFVEWYSDPKAFIVSSLMAEAREVHIIESEKQALVEVFKDSAEKVIDPEGTALKLASALTGYKIEIKLVTKDSASELPGV